MTQALVRIGRSALAIAEAADPTDGHIHEGLVVCADHLRQLAQHDDRCVDPPLQELPAEMVAFWGERCGMCGVDPSPGRACENAECRRPLHPRWPAVYCCNACALEDV